MKPIAYEFKLNGSYDDRNENVDTLVVHGDELVFPLNSVVGQQDYFRVLRHPETGDGPEFVFALPAHRVRQVRGLTEQDVVELGTREGWTNAELREHLGDALKLIGQLMGEAAEIDCRFVDGDVLESGVRKCMAKHHRPGRKPGTCIIRQAVEFVDDMQTRHFS